MDNPAEREQQEEGKQLNQRLREAAQKALEKLKADGVVKEKVEVGSAGAELVWRCSVNFHDSSLLLMSSFVWEPGTDMSDLEDAVLDAAREAFKRGEWTD